MQLEAIIVLTQPIADAIGQLEADKPYLSQMVTVWHDIMAKAHAWMQPEKGLTWNLGLGERSDGENREGTGLINVIEFRKAFCYHPAHSAAYILDPINWDDKGVENEVSPSCFLQLLFS